MKLEEIVFASHNEGKIKEIKKLLAPYGIKVKSALDMNLPDVEETGKTFEENSRLHELIRIFGNYLNTKTYNGDFFVLVTKYLLIKDINGFLYLKINKIKIINWSKISILD